MSTSRSSPAKSSDAARRGQTSAGRRRLRAFGEDAAARGYEARGFQIVDHNWRTREGEIDLVARRGGTIVVCDVGRGRDRFGSPVESVTTTKQRRLRTLAEGLAEHPARHGDARFDVACVTPAGALPAVAEVEVEAAF